MLNDTVIYKDAIMVFAPVKYGIIHNMIFFLLVPVIIFSVLQVMQYLIRWDRADVGRLIDISLISIILGMINIFFILLLTFNYISYSSLQNILAIAVFYISAVLIFLLLFIVFNLIYKIIVNCRPRWRSEHMWLDKFGVLISSLFSLWITNRVLLESYKMIKHFDLIWLTGFMHPSFLTILRVFFIIFTAHVFSRAFTSIVVNNLKSRIGNKGIAGNVMSILQNISTTVIVIVSIFLILREFYVNIAPIVTGLGIVGIGLGWILQQPLQDLAGCIFIILEDAVHLGDVIELPNKIVGKVEQLTLRTIKIRSLKGELHIVPYHKLEIITNHTCDTGFAMLDVSVAYNTDIQTAIDAIRSSVDDLAKNQEYQPYILGPIEMFGVHSLSDSAIVIRFRLPTNPHEKWSITRALNKIIKEKFDKLGIKIPFPQRELHIIQETRK